MANRTVSSDLCSVVVEGSLPSLSFSQRILRERCGFCNLAFLGKTLCSFLPASLSCLLGPLLAGWFVPLFCLGCLVPCGPLILKSTTSEPTYSCDSGHVPHWFDFPLASHWCSTPTCSLDCSWPMWSSLHPLLESPLSLLGWPLWEVSQPDTQTLLCLVCTKQKQG